jgi:cyclase
MKAAIINYGMDNLSSVQREFENINAEAIIPNHPPSFYEIKLADRGDSKILLTSIDRDGTILSYDLELVERVSRVADIPIIASDSAGNYQHMINVVRQIGAPAVTAASIFHFTEQTPTGAKSVIQVAETPVRLNFVGTTQA